jgi:hypothetical protein
LKELFTPRRFSAASSELIEKANEIIEEYAAQGFDFLTLRQLYYQMVARAIIENTVQSYKRLGSIINDARYAGLIDWSALEDRTRNLKGSSHWESPEQIIRAVSYGYSLDKWKDQDIRPEIWVEKEALAGIVERAATDNDLEFLSCRGYMSASEMYEASRRIRSRLAKGQETAIIYLGDHDPSGLDMSDGDIPKRFEIFLRKYGEEPVEINRIALNWDQIEQYNPPPNPAKETDSRFQAYQEKFGDDSWELDALEPTVLLDLIQSAVDIYKDESLYAAVQEREDEDKSLLSLVSQKWASIVKFLKRKEK